MLNIVAKSTTLDLGIVSKQTNPTTFYFGAGWDSKDGSAVDLDIVIAATSNGKIRDANDFIYFGNRSQAAICAGITLSADCQTGDTSEEGDDEDVVINTSLLPDDIDEVVVGLVAYAGADLSCAPNTIFRVCDGDNEDSPEIGRIDSLSTDAAVGDTGVVAFKLKRTATGWVMENVSQLLQIGAGSGAISAFGARFHD